jgi:flagellum-specific peptidoglycan hydrolase FlgJ
MKTSKSNLFKRLVLFVSLALLLTANAFPQSPKHQLYVDKYSSLAVALMHEYRIPASVILGVAFVESGAGTSVLSRKFHNHFGIIGKNKNAIKKLGRNTPYREFESDTASFRYFCVLISHKKFFPNLENSTDHKEWVYAIRKSGYAEAADHWQQQVLAAIRNYKLTDYDAPEQDPLNYLPRAVNGVKTSGMLVNSQFVPLKNAVSSIPAASSNLKAYK